MTRQDGDRQSTVVLVCDLKGNAPIKCSICTKLSEGTADPYGLLLPLGD